MKMLIAVPCLDMVHTLFMASLLALKRDGVEIAISSSSLVYDARNALAEKAVNEGFDRVMWLDSDMAFPPDLLDRMSARIDEGREFVSGLYFTRKNPVHPVMYGTVKKTKNGMTLIKPVMDYPQNEVFQIHGCGFGAVMHTVDLLRRIGDKYGPPFSPEPGFGEDLSFCRRAEGVGATLWCDSGIQVDHIGLSLVNEATYLSSRG